MDEHASRGVVNVAYALENPQSYQSSRLRAPTRPTRSGYIPLGHSLTGASGFCICSLMTMTAKSTLRPTGRLKRLTGHDCARLPA